MNSSLNVTPGGRVFRLYSALADRPHLLIAGATGLAYAMLATAE